MCRCMCARAHVSDCLGVCEGASSIWEPQGAGLTPRVEERRQTLMGIKVDCIC